MNPTLLCNCLGSSHLLLQTDVFQCSLPRHICRFFCTLTKNNFMALIKLASADISKPWLDNNSVITPSPSCFQGWIGVISSSSRCLPESPISPRACLWLISPSQLTQRKFLEGWARQIATDLSLPSAVVSFLRKLQSAD